jgi:hypothetical protein
MVCLATPRLIRTKLTGEDVAHGLPAVDDLQQPAPKPRRVNFVLTSLSLKGGNPKPLRNSK